MHFINLSGYLAASVQIKPVVKKPVVSLAFSGKSFYSVFSLLTKVGPTNIFFNFTLCRRDYY